MKVFFLTFLFVISGLNASYTSRELKCLVCRATIKEMIGKIEKVSDKKKIQVGGYRVDSSGNLKEKVVPFARSGMHLSELMDEVCQSMEEYARATDKETGKLVLFKLITDGKMNPDITKVDIIQDNDLNKNLNFYCESVVEEFEDVIFDELKQPTTDPVDTICTKASRLCDTLEKDEL